MKTTEQIKEMLNRYDYAGLCNFVHAGSDNYPNIINVYSAIDDKLGEVLAVVYLQLDGWVKIEYYPIK
jgi:hypothetical protein